MWDLSDCFNFLDAILEAGSIRGEVIGSETITNGNHSIYVDTCFTEDTGKYETGIGIDRKDIIIVEEYDSKDEAIDGHHKWLTYVAGPYPLSFSSIQILEITIVEE